MASGSNGASASTVVLVEGDPLARRAIMTELATMPQVGEVVEAADWRAGAEVVARERPAAVVLELRSGQEDPVEPIARLLEAAPGAAVLVFSVVDSREVEIASMRAGARGFVSKQAGLKALRPALLAVLRGETAVSRRLTREIIAILREAPEHGGGLRPIRSRLTNREWEVLDLVASGNSTREIADHLVLTEDTVYSHIKNVMRKYEVHSRAAAVALMRREQQAAD